MSDGCGLQLTAENAEQNAEGAERISEGTYRSEYTTTE